MRIKRVCTFLLVLTAGCQVRGAPGPNPIEPCIPMTGERDYDAQIVEHPPETVTLGMEIRFRFSGGYYDVFPSCEIVGNSMVFHYPTIEELGDSSRKVEVFLNNVLIHTQDCTYDCEISFSLPKVVEAGAYPLIIRPEPWLYHPRDMEFVLEVTERLD